MTKYVLLIDRPYSNLCRQSIHICLYQPLFKVVTGIDFKQEATQLVTQLSKKAHFYYLSYRQS